LWHIANLITPRSRAQIALANPEDRMFEIGKLSGLLAQQLVSFHELATGRQAKLP
jgi:hypothetical protein